MPQAILAIVLSLFLLPCFTQDAKAADLLTPAERSWLTQHDGKIILAPGSYPPVDFIDAQGQHSGITGDYIRLLEKKLHFHFKLRRLHNWNEVLSEGKARRVDVITGMQKTLLREKYWLLPITKSPTSS